MIRAQVRIVDRTKKETIRQEVMESVQVERVKSQVLAPIRNRESNHIILACLPFARTEAISLQHCCVD